MRLFASGFLVIATVSTAAQSASHFQDLSWPLSDGISELWLFDAKTSLRVAFFGQSVPDGRGEVPKPPPVSGVQVWILRKDGTALRQQSGIRVNGAAFNAGLGAVSADLSFEHAEARDLAGVVVGVNGKLIIREIRPN